MIGARRARTVIALALGAAATLGACSDNYLKVGIGSADGGAADLTAAPALPVSSDEIVKRLAKLIWNATPDAALTTATAGKIKTKADVGALARQMLTDARARVGVGAFYRWWLQLDKVPAVTKDAALFPQWTAALAGDAARETEAFGVGVTLDMEGTFPTLLTGGFSYVNERLAAVYDLTNVTGAELRKVNLDATHRAGLLTQPALLALNANPAATAPSGRGNFIRAHLYCMVVPVNSPPNDPPPMPPANATGRQRLEALVTATGCHNCHDLIDPIGFAFEGLDAIGRARTTDNGSPVDATGMLANGAGVQTAFNGPVELATILAGVGDVAACFVDQWLSYALGRPVSLDDAAVVSLGAAFKSTGQNLRALIVAVAQSDTFLAP